MKRVVFLTVCLLWACMVPCSAEQSPEQIGDDTQNMEQAEKAVSMKGVTLSALLPGAGQFYTGHFVKGGTFLALEGIAGGTALYWHSEASRREGLISHYSDSSRAYLRLADGLEGEALDSMLYTAGRFSVLGERARFETDMARFTSYNALAWMIGGYVYNVMDALGESGALSHPGERDPGRAGWLAAVPGLGLGQLYNGYPGKAGMVIMTQFSLGVMAYNHHRLMGRASEQYNLMRDSTSAVYAYRSEHLSYWKSRYDEAFSKRNTYLWYSLAFYLYSIFDSVVDAHLSDYMEKMGLQPDLAIGADEASVRITFKL